MSLAIRAGLATVALGPGHSYPTDVLLSSTRDAVRFALPGLPQDVVFTGRVRRGRLSGTVVQGRLRGTFSLHKGSSPALDALGVYRSATGATLAIVQAEGLPTWLVELPSGTTHGLNESLTTVGGLLGGTSGDGALAVDRGGLTWTHAGSSVRYDRIRLRQWEVRVGAIAGTLSLPAGGGKPAAAVMVHGSDPAGRDEFQTFSAYLVSKGVGVLGSDKRGIAESGGTFPGSLASAATIDLLARDVQSQVAFLRHRPRVDPVRVGVIGASQAGWVIARAASRDPQIRWAVPLVGPAVTQGETDLFTSLAGAETSQPAGPRPQLIAQVRAAGRSGFDPLPYLERLSIPVLWVYGDDDRNVPTEISVERLQSIAAGHDFTWTVLHMTHALIDLPNGLYSSLAGSRGFTADLFPTVGAWLAAHGIT
jgi:uncharacterized protein